MKKKATLTISLLLLILFSCATLSNAASAVDSKEQLLKRKWQLNRQVFINHDNTGTDSSTVTGTKHDFIEFRKDGTALVMYKGSKDVLQYQVVSDSLLSIENTTYKIIQLDNKALQLYQDNESNGNYNREWLELKQ